MYRMLRFYLYYQHKVKVDGQTESLVIVEDPLPANTVFESVEVLEKNQNAQLLYRLAEGEYTRGLPADKTKVGYACCWVYR